MKLMMKVLLLISLLGWSSQAFAERGCTSLSTFLDLALRQNRGVSQAGQIENRINDLLTAGEQVRVLDNGNYVEARVLRYEDGKVIYSKQDGTEIAQQIGDDFNDFFKLADEVPAKEPEVENLPVVAGGNSGGGSTDLVPTNGGGSTDLVPTTGGQTDEVGSTKLPEEYVFEPEILDPEVPPKVEPAGSIEQAPLEMVQGPDGSYYYPGADMDLDITTGQLTLSDSGPGSIDPLSIGGPDPVLKLDAPQQPLLLDAPDTPLLLTSDAVSSVATTVTKADIPDTEFISFRNLDGELIVGRIDPNSNGERIFARGDQRVARESIPIPFDEIEPGSVRMVDEADVPFQVIRRPSASELPDFDPNNPAWFSYTSPKGENAYTARILGKTENSVTILRRNNATGQVDEVTVPFSEMRAASITTVNRADVPDGLIVRAAEIPDNGRFVTFKNGNGEDVVGRVLGTTDDGNVRIVVRGDSSSRTGEELAVSLDVIKPGSVSNVDEADVPYQIIRRPEPSEIPSKDSWVTYTSPKQENSYTAQIVGDPANGSVRVRIVGEDGELGPAQSVSYERIRAESLRVLEGDDLPAVARSTSTELAVVDDVGGSGSTALTVIDDTEEVVDGTGTAIVLRENTDVARVPGTEVEQRVLEGEILAGEVAVRQQPAAAIDGPVIDGVATRVDDVAEVPQLTYTQRVAAIEPPPGLTAAQLKETYGDSVVRFTIGDTEFVGTFGEASDGKVLFRRLGDSQDIRLDPNDINRAQLDVFNIEAFTRPDTDLVFIKDNMEPFTGPFGALDEAGQAVNDADVLDALATGGRVSRILDGMMEIITKGGRKLKVPVQRLMDGGATMMNKIGDLRLNFNRLAKLSRADQTILEVVMSSDDNVTETGTPGGQTETETETGTPGGQTETETETETDDQGNGTVNDLYTDNDNDDDGGSDDGGENVGIPPAPSGNPVGPQFQQPKKLQIIRTRGVY